MVQERLTMRKIIEVLRLKWECSACSEGERQDRVDSQLQRGGVGEGSEVMLLSPSINRCPFQGVDVEIPARPGDSSSPGSMPSGS
jgi:hypothetical protein